MKYQAIVRPGNRVTLQLPLEFNRLISRSERSECSNLDHLYAMEIESVIRDVVNHGDDNRPKAEKLGETTE